jgi:hypothetical protein
MLHFFVPETVELVHFDGSNLTFRSRRRRRQGKHKVRLLLAVASRMEKLDLPVAVLSSREVPGGTECHGPVELSAPSARTLQNLLRAVARAGADRRRSERTPASLRVCCSRLPGGQAQTVDVSEHGMQLSVQGPVPPGTQLELTVITERLLSVRGRVVWSAEGRLGVELVA